MPDPHYLIKPLSFFDTFSRKPGEQATTHYCPGCGHGVLHKLIAESIDKLGIQDRVILVGPVGCSVFIYYYLETSAISAPHGRAQAVGVGVSRTSEEAITLVYQGDGDLAAIGTSHTIHAANRGENMIVFFVNNNIYGMTGGQIAPTSILGQKTATSPRGRDFFNEGPPIKMSELIASLEAPVFVARTAVNTPKNVRNCLKIIQRGLQAQANRKGYVFIEVLSACPTNWRKTPVEASQWIEEVVSQEFPLGVFKDIIDEAEPHPKRTKPTEEFAISQIFPEQKPKKPISDLKIVTGQEEEPEIPSGEKHPKLSFPIKLKCAGFGGQGVLSLGLGIANIAIAQNRSVTWLPSYGPEMRGGVANCSVVLGLSSVGSPIVDEPDVLVAMNKLSLEVFGPKVPASGHIFYNSSMVDATADDFANRFQATLYPVNATEIANRLNNPKVCNSVFLGAVSKALGLFSLEQLQKYVRNTFADAVPLCQANIAAIEAGWNIKNNI